MLTTERTAEYMRRGIRQLRTKLDVEPEHPLANLYRSAISVLEADLAELESGGDPCIGCGKPSDDGVCDVCHDTACGA